MARNTKTTQQSGNGNGNGSDTGGGHDNPSDSGSGRRRTNPAAHPGGFKPTPAPDNVYTTHTYAHEDDLTERDEEWICPATDKYHRSERYAFSAPPYMGEIVDAILATKRYPYANRADIMRHALSRYIDWIGRRAPEVGMHYEVFRQNTEVLFNEVRRKKQALDTMYKLDRVIESMVKDGECAQAYALLSKMRKQIDQLPVNAGKRKYTEHYERKYGQFMATGGKVMPTTVYLADESGEQRLQVAPDGSMFGGYIGEMSEEIQ